MNRALDIACRATKAWIDGLDDRSVAATATLSDLKRSFVGPLPTDGSNAEEVVQALARDAGVGMHGSTPQVGARRWKPFGLIAIGNPLLAIRFQLARWAANWRRHAQDERVRRELDRLSEFHLDDIGVTRSPRRAIKLDIGRGVPPAVTMEFEYALSASGVGREDAGARKEQGI